VARVLVQQGCEVHALIRESSNTYRIKDLLPALHVVNGDLLDGATVAQQVRELRPELCLHLAWYVEPGKYASALENMELLRASLRLAKTLAECGCKRLVATGSLFEYDAAGTVTELSPTRSRHLYAASKLALFEALDLYCQLAGMELAWPRLFYQYGPYEHPHRLIPTVINSLLRSQKAELTPGEQVGDYLHVADTAAAIGAVARSSLTGPVNIGSGQPVRIRDIALLIGQLLGRPDLLVFGAKPYGVDAPMHLVADTTLLRRHTDWQPQFTLDTGLRQTIAWWKDQLEST